MDRQKKIIWIAWQKHRRTVSLCEYLGIESRLFESIHHRIIKHPLFIIKTLSILLSKRPEVLIVQNPSIVLTTIACLLKKIFKYRLLVDTHNVGIFPENLILERCRFLYRYIYRTSDLTIVTNKKLSQVVNECGGNTFVLSDRIPNIKKIEALEKSKQYKIVAISTFGYDEPYIEIMKASKELARDIKLYMTGNTKNLTANLIHEYQNHINFTGYLPDKDYWRLLCSADLIVDLTNRENCLVCGAYEALSLEKPLILTGTAALKKHFYKGVVFTDNNANEIAKSISFGIQNLTELKKEAMALKDELCIEWEKQARYFRDIVFETQNGAQENEVNGFNFRKP